jgi:hypothetical protein
MSTAALRVTTAIVVLLTASATTPWPEAAAAPTRYSVSISSQPSTVLVGRTIHVDGLVRPRDPGHDVRLQLLSPAGWGTVAVVRLGARSRYSATYAPPGTGSYQLRVRKPGDGHHARGTSATVTVTVTPSLPPT